METAEHQMAPVSGASSKRMRPVITMVAARPMSEVGFRSVPASPSVVSQSATDSHDSIHPSCAKEILQSKSVPPVRPRIIRPSHAQDAPPETPAVHHVAEHLQPPAPPVRPQPASGPFVPPIPQRSHQSTHQSKVENSLNEFLERKSPVSLVPRRPTIISAVHSEVQSIHTDHAESTGEVMSEHEAPFRVRPTIIGFPRRQPQAETRPEETSLMANGGISEKSHKVCGYLQTGAQAAREGIKERYEASSLSHRQPDTLMTDRSTANMRTVPLAKPKPYLAPKPQLKPKPGYHKQASHPESQQVSPVLTAASVEKATAPVIEKATKQTFDVVQKHTEKSVQQAIMTKFVTPHLGSSQFVQKRTAPLVEKATKQMYASAEKQAEASAQKTIVSAVVGHQPQSSAVTHGVPAVQSGRIQAMPAGIMSKTVTASSVEKATAPMVEKATKQSFGVIQKHTEKSMQQAIMSKVVTPHLGSSQFVQKRAAPLVEKATNQIYSSAEKQAEASVQKTIVSAVVGNQSGSSEHGQTPRPVHSDTNQLFPAKISTKVKSTLDKVHMPSPLRHSSDGHSVQSTPTMTPAPLGTGRAAESPDVPVTRRKGFGGGIKSKLSKARPKSMNLDMLKHMDDHADDGRTQSIVQVHDDGMTTKKKHPPPRPATGPQRPVSKNQPTARADNSEDWGSGFGLSVSPPKTTRLNIPHGVAVFAYVASQPDELSFQVSDTVTLLRKVDDQWFYGQAGGEEGIFPASYIDVVLPIPDEGKIHDMGNTSYPSRPTPMSNYHSSNEPTFNSQQGKDTCVKAAALYTFVGQPGELSFVTGSTISVYGKLTSDWLYGELFGELGRFPASFVSVTMETLPQLDLESVGADHGAVADGGTKEDYGRDDTVSGWDNGNESVVDSVVMQGYVGHEASYCIALHPFTGESAEDLTFGAGDRITLLGYVDTDWLRGSLDGREGIFPKAFVDVIEDLTSDVTDTQTISHNRMTNATTVPPVVNTEQVAHSTYAAETYPECSGLMARALFDFTGDTADDLSFRCGQDIKVLEWINEDWMKGRLAGRTGIFPANFVEVVGK